MSVTEKWVIIDLETNMALYGVEDKTLQFSSEKIAIEVANQFFSNKNRYLITKITQ